MASFRSVDPKQSFPEMEERVGARWKEERVFERSMEQRADADVWSFYEGPPTANGRPGSHHRVAGFKSDQLISGAEAFIPPDKITGADSSLLWHNACTPFLSLTPSQKHGASGL